jgi:1-acyl-sn-glycerol-3-phosphate acyltransferase
MFYWSGRKREGCKYFYVHVLLFIFLCLIVYIFFNCVLSIGNMFKQVEEKLSTDADIFIFPQGTRVRNGKHPFKHGAFTMAMNSSKPIVPVSCHIAHGVWNRSIMEVMSPSSPPAVTFTVHPAIAPGSSTKDELTKLAFDAVYSCLDSGKSHSD